VAYAYFGVTTDDLTPRLARRLGLGVARGALIVEVEADTPASRAGLRGGDRRVTLNGVQVTTGGDVIVRIGAHAVRSSADVSRIIAAELRPGETVRVLVLRDGKQLGFDITVGERPLVRG
jgi:S1-C subfamily serine protease